MATPIERLKSTKSLSRSILHDAYHDSLDEDFAVDSSSGSVLKKPLSLPPTPNVSSKAKVHIPPTFAEVYNDWDPAVSSILLPKAMDEPAIEYESIKQDEINVIPSTLSNLDENTAIVRFATDPQTAKTQGQPKGDPTSNASELKSEISPKIIEIPVKSPKVKRRRLKLMTKYAVAIPKTMTELQAQRTLPPIPATAKVVVRNHPPRKQKRMVYLPIKPKKRRLKLPVVLEPIPDQSQVKQAIFKAKNVNRKISTESSDSDDDSLDEEVWTSTIADDNTDDIARNSEPIEGISEGVVDSESANARLSSVSTDSAASRSNAVAPAKPKTEYKPPQLSNLELSFLAERTGGFRGPLDVYASYLTAGKKAATLLHRSVAEKLRATDMGLMDEILIEKGQKTFAKNARMLERIRTKFKDSFQVEMTQKMQTLEHTRIMIARDIKALIQFATLMDELYPIT